MINIKSISNRSEFLIVIICAFGLPIFTSVMAFISGNTESVSMTDRELYFTIILECVVLVLLGGFLKARGWTLRGLGFRFNVLDPAIAFLLLIGAYLSVIVVLMFSAVFLFQEVPEQPVVADVSVGVAILVSIINPVFEELFVLGYVVSFFKLTKKDFWLAVSISVLIRVSYHLYQGVYGLLSILPVGVIFTIWFARTGRIWPVIIAHAAIDLIGLMASQYVS